MACHRLRGTDEGMMAKEHFLKRFRLIHIALRGRRGMGIDIVDIVGIHSGIIHGTLHGHTTAILTGSGDAAAIAGEAIATDLSEDSGTTGHGMVVVLEDKGGSTAAGDESVAVAVERTAGFCRLVHMRGKGAESIEGGHGVVVGLLGTTAEDHVLQPLLDEHVGKTNGMASAGTGGTDSEVDALDMEDGA